MKYFTPDLYFRFNSSDDDRADRADEEWEESTKQYRHYIKNLSSEMPPRVKNLAESLCLHDAELLAIAEDVPESGFWLQAPLAVATLTLQRGETVVNITYMLWDHVAQTECREGRPWSDLRICWLYDEIELESRHPYLYRHRILLSDGRILEIPFFDVIVHASSARSPESDVSSQTDSSTGPDSPASTGTRLR